MIEEILWYIIYILVVCILFKPIILYIKATQRYSDAKQYLISVMYDWLSSKPQPDYRNEFKQVTLEDAIKHSDKANHSHWKSATDRCKANTAANAFTNIIGHIPYSYMCSVAEEAKLDGARLHYIAKDLQTYMKFTPITKNHIIRLTDVDYYLNMNNILQGHHVLLYTFVPTEVAGSTDDATFYIDSQNNVITDVNGGAHYKHQLWNYDTDHIMVDHWWGSSMYLVEQKLISKHRRLILLNHIRQIYTPLAWLLPGYRLSRRQFVQKDFVLLRSQEINDVGVTKSYISISTVDCRESTKIAEIPYQVSAMRYCNSKTPQISDIERILRVYEVPDAPFAASLLYSYFQQNKPTIQDHVSACIKNNYYQTLYPLITEDGESTVRSVDGYLFNDSYHPVRSFNNDTACIKGRIDNVRNMTNQYPPFYWTCMNEFIDLLIPRDVRNSLVPYDFKQQYDNFDRPTQRGLINSILQVFYTMKNITVKSFQKAEVYAKVTSPRNISTLPMEHNFRLGQFSYALSDNVFKQAHWYAFGKHPKIFSNELHNKAAWTSTAIETDISKCDGSTGLIHHCLIKSVVMSAFHSDYHREILSLINKESHVKGITKHGLEYTADYNTLSGSSMTSWRNSVINAFSNYVALRFEHSPPVAYEKLGMYGGDDGVTYDIDPDLLTKVFAKMGMLITAQVIHRDNPISFLGRIYLNPWTTDQSIADVKRHVRKLHLTVTPSNVPVNVVMYRKAMGYKVTDPNTPILKEWANYVFRCFPQPSQEEIDKYSAYRRQDTSYWSKFEHPFPELLSYESAYEIVSSQFEGIDISLICHLLDQQQQPIGVGNKLYNIITPEQKIEISADLNGELIIVNEDDTKHQEKVRHNKKIKIKTQTVKKSKVKVSNQCRFYTRKQPCPYGHNCKFDHK